MAKELVVQKNRTNVVGVSLGFDVSQDTFSSDIRVSDDSSSELIASWSVSFLTDGTDGELVLTLDNSLLDEVVYKTGYMDIKRISSSEPLSVFDFPLLVVFRDTVTA